MSGGTSSVFEGRGDRRVAPVVRFGRTGAVQPEEILASRVASERTSCSAGGALSMSPRSQKETDWGATGGRFGPPVCSRGETLSSGKTRGGPGWVAVDPTEAAQPDEVLAWRVAFEQTSCAAGTQVAEAATCRQTPGADAARLAGCRLSLRERACFRGAKDDTGRAAHVSLSYTVFRDGHRSRSPLESPGCLLLIRF